MAQRSKNSAGGSLIKRLGRVDFTPPWSLTSAAIVVIVAFFLLLIGAAVGYIWLEDAPSARLLGWSFGALLMLLLVWQTLAKDRAALKLNAPRLPLALIAFVGLGIAIALDVVGLAITRAFLPAPETISVASGTVDIVGLVLAGVLLIIAQPIGEELVFRGVLLPALRTAWGGWVGLIVSAIAYGIFHWLAYTPTYSAEYGDFAPYWYGLIVPMVGGFVFGVVRVETNSTRAAIIAHAAFGLFAVFKVVVLVT